MYILLHYLNETTNYQQFFLPYQNKIYVEKFENYNNDNNNT